MRERCANGALTVVQRLANGVLPAYCAENATALDRIYTVLRTKHEKGAEMTQQKQILYSPVDIDDAEFVSVDDVDAKLETENVEFEQFKSEMHEAQDDAKITVGKKHTDSRGRGLGRKLFQCFECGIDDYTFSQLCARIREDFGTGLYLIQGRDSNGKYKFGKTVGIQAPNSDDTVNTGMDVGALIDKFSDAMERQQQRTEAMFRNITGPQTGGDAFDQMTKMMTAMGGMMGHMGLTPQPQKSITDQLTEFKLLQELFAGSDGAGGESNLFTLLTETVKSFGPALGLAIAAQQQAGAIPASGPIRAALPKPIEAKKETLNEQLESMRPQINFLVEQAGAGAKPEDVVNALMPGIPENSLESIEGFLQQENAIDICAQVNSGVNNYRQWFLEWRAVMLKTILSMFDENIEDSESAAELDQSLTGGQVLGETAPAVAGDDKKDAGNRAASENSNDSDINGDSAGGAGNAGDP